MRVRGYQPSVFGKHHYTTCWVSSGSLSGRAVSRGRHRETFSESRLPETGLSGSMGPKPDLPTSDKPMEHDNAQTAEVGS
jgi:hypothetical protein